MNLVLIHGRDQQGKDKDKLKQLWVDTLSKGLAKNNLSLPPDINIIFPFYGDVLDSLTRGLGQPLDGVTTMGAENSELLSFEFEMLTELAANAAVSQEQILTFSPSTTEMGPLNWPIVQAIMKALDAHTGMGEYTIKKFTADVYAYLNYPGVRMAINTLITEELQDGPTVVVAHSLGTIIGYNILHECQLEVRGYVTLGSPLGLRAVTKRLSKPLKRPQCIKGSWYNAYDDGDFVALNPLDTIHFNISPKIINSAHVKNHTENQHGIEGYLDDAKVAKQIYDALTK